MEGTDSEVATKQTEEEGIEAKAAKVRARARGENAKGIRMDRDACGVESWAM